MLNDIVLLVTLSELKKYADFPTNIDFVQRMNPYITQALRVDLKRAMGKVCFFEMVNKYNAGDPDYVKLVEGDTYTCDDVEIEYDGIIPVIANYALSRFYEKQQVNIVRKGLVVKTNEFSQPIDKKTKSDLVLSSRSLAKSYITEITDYLSENTDKFKKCMSFCGCGYSSDGGVGVRKGSISITAIKGY